MAAVPNNPDRHMSALLHVHRLATLVLDHPDREHEVADRITGAMLAVREECRCHMCPTVVKRAQDAQASAWGPNDWTNVQWTRLARQARGAARRHGYITT